jgi:hypothetical protein
VDSATVLVILLTAGGIALLVWFEINSRRNAGKMKQLENCVQSESASVAGSKSRADVKKVKAA